MLKIDGLKIYLTRGDSAALNLKLSGAVLSEQDEVVLTVKKSPAASRLIRKHPAAGSAYPKYRFVFTPEDTKNLPFGSYQWDIRINLANGGIYTPPAFPQLFYIGEVIGDG
jgi:hypothetical protein